MSYVFIIIFSSLTTAVLMHIFAESRDHLSRRNEAAVKFRRAFVTEIQALSSPFNKQIDATNILETAFTRHYAALQEFNLFLSKNECNTLDRLWHEYCEYEDIYPCFDQYNTQGVSSKQRTKNEELAYQRIKAMVNFAVPKRHWIIALSIYKLKDIVSCKNSKKT